MFFIRAMVQIFSFVEIASMNRKFHLSPDENICTITLITLHYMYNFLTTGLRLNIFSWKVIYGVHAYKSPFQFGERIKHYCADKCFST